MTVKELRNGPVFFESLQTITKPLQFTLPNSDVVATAFPVYSHNYVPRGLVEHMFKQFNDEIERGDTYPQAEKSTLEEYIKYWFHSFCVVVLRTANTEIDPTWTDWDSIFLGTFYIKPNYPGRCSHNCNAGFMVNHSHRGKKIGYRLAQVYLKWAPLLGYKYSVFNLVFVTNTASWKIWDRFKFDRIGYLPKAALLKGHDERVDAILFGKDLTNVEQELLKDLDL